MKDSVWFSLGWCLCLHQSAVSIGARLCSTIRQPNGIHRNRSGGGEYCQQKGEELGSYTLSHQYKEDPSTMMAEGDSDGGKILNILFLCKNNVQSREMKMTQAEVSQCSLMWQIIVSHLWQQ